MVFTHLAPVAFLVLGLAFVNLMVNVTALIANKDQVRFYWPHTAFCFITFFTMLLFWWTCYPLNDPEYFPNEGWNLFTYLLFLVVPMLMFMICEVLTPYNTPEYAKHIDLKKYYYKYHRVILGLALTLQVCLIGNFFVFYGEDYYSIKVLGRVVMLFIMLPMVISSNRIVHEVGMGIFFVGFLYTVAKYHIWMVYF